MRSRLAIPALAGALALALAGLAATAQAAGSSAGEATTSPSALAPAAGSEIEQQVRKKRSAREALRDVRASVEEGTVTLRGSVPRAAERIRAEKLATSVSGVETVRNELRVGSASDVSSPPPGDG